MMSAEQKQAARNLIDDFKDAGNEWDEAAVASHMTALLQELVDAPEAEPVARVTGYYAGYLSISTIDGRVLPAGTALYLAPPAPSVPDGWMRAIDEAMVVHHIGIADRADGYEEAKKKLNELLAINSDIARDCSEAPADLARDAARYRWLRNPTTDPALVIDKRVGPSFWDYEYRAGDELDAAIDAAIEREKLKGQS